MNRKENSNQHYWWLLIFLTIILVVIAYFRVSIQLDIGPPYDTFDYLANAAEIAGYNIGYSDPRPPFLSLLASIVFRVNGLSEAPIFIIDGIFFVIGAIGLYLLFRLRFNGLNSFLGSLLYATIPLVITYVGVGYPDLPSVSISIWALYLTVLAVKKDSRYFYVSFPLVMVAFLTKFNQILIVFPILFYLFLNWQSMKNHKNIYLGVLLSTLVIIPFLIFFNWKYGNPIWLFMDFYGTSEGSAITSQNSNDSLFYLKYLPLVIGNIALTVIMIIFTGLLISWVSLIRGKLSLSINKERFRDNFRIKMIIIVFLFISFIFSLGNVSYLISEILFLFLILAIYKLLNIDRKYDLDLLFFSWFIAFLIFQSVYSLKDIRYFLTILPPFTYFLIRGLNIVENQVKIIYNKNLVVYLVPILVGLIIISTSIYIPTLTLANQNNKNINEDMSLACDWLINYDPQYKSKVIYSDLWALTGWHLQTEIKKMPRFKGNETYYYSAPSYNLTNEDIFKMNNQLIINNADYYFSTHNGLNLANYVIVRRFNLITIYKRL